MLMRFFLPVLYAILSGSILAATSSATRPAIDRQAIHESRIAGLDLAHRQLWLRSGRASAIASTDIPEFRMSNSVSPARFDQEDADVIQLADKGWLAVWDDNRFGSRKIFWQRFDSLLNADGGNELVADSTTGADYVDPVLASDTLGHVYLFYRDRTNGLVFGTRYTSTLQVDLPVFLVNDTTSNSFAGPFDLAVFPGGQAVVVWENYSGSGSTIEMRLYGPSGTSQLGPVTVNSDGGSAQHWVPSVAIAPGSGFLVVWEDYRNAQADVRCRQYNGAGSAIGPDFAVVAPPEDTANQYAPVVAYSSKDRYVVGWVDQRLGQEIYLQRYSQTTGLVGGNRLISGGDTLISNWDLHLATATSGRTLATWAEFGAANRILGLRLDSGLVAADTSVKLNSVTTGRRWNPCSKYNANSGVALTWTEFINEDADINLRILDSVLAPMALSETQVNDDLLGAPSTDPFILASSRTRHIVLWTDQLYDAGDILIRNISVAGMPYSGEYRLNQDAGYNLQTEPYAAASDNNVLAVWIDSRNVGGLTGQRIYGRFCNLNGVPISDEFIISDTSANAVKASPVVAMAPNGQALVAWIDRRDASPQVWGRWLTTAGALDGPEFQLSDEVGGLAATHLNAGVDTGGRFGISWLDVGESNPTFKAVWYASNKALDDSFIWTPSISGVSIDDLAADYQADGSLTLFWSGESPGRSEGYVTQLSSAGGVTHAPFVATDDTLAAVSSPSVAVSENGDVSLTWLDRRGGSAQVYYQILDPGLSPVGVNAPVSAQTPEFMKQPYTEAFRGRAWYVWSDPRTEGMNIFCAGVLYDPTGVDDGDQMLPTEYHLAQNYPNPFNPSTVISFSLPMQSKVRLDVFNVLGRHVTTLIDDNLSAGEHYVTWAGEDSAGRRVASGVYFYRLGTDAFTQTRKMMLLK